MTNTQVQVSPNVRAVTAYASAARTATPNTVELGLIEGSFREHAFFVFDITAVTSTPSLTFKVEGVDRVSGKTWTILTGAAEAAVATRVYRVSPSLAASANAVAQDVLPPFIRITVTHGNANSATYSLAVYFS